MNGLGDLGFPIGDDPNAVQAREQGFPWCDTCKRPAVFREGIGFLHSTEEHPYGVPRDRGYDHLATIREWDSTPVWPEVDR